ncbi:hypothetical protein CHRYSEOSP005_29190 [Chryseobacterium sp. Alg-005]|uniref:DUF7010 family protein n=1 Tax=Chryseobacterium sp. Alg-005 TaxID=3159516 RepID=UPI003555A5BB
MENNNLNMDSISDAQNDMKNGYGYGSTGVIVSGVVWLTSCLIACFYSSQHAMWALIIGGMFISPLAALVEKLVGIKGRHEKNNPLATLAMESTVWMIMCIPLAYGLSLSNVGWFFQGMLMIIGGRYLTFASIYGVHFYWILGTVLGLSAIILFTIKADAWISSLTGGSIEIIMGGVLYSLYKKSTIKS